MAAAEVVGVAHHVERGSVLATELAFGQPVLEPGRRLLVTGLRIHRVGLFAALQMDRVVGAAPLQLGFQFRADHVVGRTDDC